MYVDWETGCVYTRVRVYVRGCMMHARARACVCARVRLHVCVCVCVYVCVRFKTLNYYDTMYSWIFGYAFMYEIERQLLFPHLDE